MNPVKPAAFRFRPFSRRQKQVLTWWCSTSPMQAADGLIADGSIRSGKTVSLSLSFVLWGMARFNGQNFALCGKTIASLRRNVVGVLKQMLTARGYTAAERRGDNLLIVTRGTVSNYYYLFGGKDEGSQDLIQGITLAGALFDEVALMPESFVNQATARCSVDGSKFWFNCNPEGPEHWFYKSWILQARAKNLLYLHFTMDDNLSLSEPIKARYRAQYTGVFYERYIRGRWVVAEGLVYPFVAANPDAYLLRGPTAGMDGRFFVSIDYGTHNPCSMGLWCVQANRAVRIKESYYNSREVQHQRTDEEHYAALEELTRGYYVQEVVVDPSAASFIETIRRHGRYMVRAAANDVLDGIRVTASLLQAGRVQIHESCTDALREFKTYCWDDKAPQDAVIKENDHAMDDIRYFVIPCWPANTAGRIGGSEDVPKAFALAACPDWHAVWRCPRRKRHYPVRPDGKCPCPVGPDVRDGRPLVHGQK